MKIFRVFCFLITIPCLAINAQASTKKVVKSGTAKNVILFIGDGMGPTVLTATRLNFYGPTGSLTVDTFPNLAKVRTHSLDDHVTDSAAGATAMATGVKVNNGVIGAFKHELGRPITPLKQDSILNMAHKAGLATGLVTTVELFHATPASFYAKQSFRKMYKEIITDLSKSPVDVILGGGDRWIRNFEQNNEFKKFKVVRDRFSTDSCKKQQILGSFSPAAFPFVLDRNEGHISLPEMTDMTLKCLNTKSKKGFFLMVEAGRIDQALHARKIPEALYETQELNKTIENTINYLKKTNQLKDTLILVTADHDTGGMAINGPIGTPRKLISKNQEGRYASLTTKHYSGQGPDFRVLRLSTDRSDIKNLPMATHTGTDVNLYGMGPGAEKVRGTIQNTKIFEIMKEALNL